MNSEQKFINALNNFAMAIEQIASEITMEKKQSNKSLKDMLTGNDSLIRISQDILTVTNEIKTHTTDILKNTKTIITKLSESKKKEKGVFDTIAEKQAKTNMADGIKSILLISTAVLAIGSAFSILKNVDFASVIALSIAIPVLSMSFIKVAESGLNINKAFEVSKTLMVMSLTLLATSVILSFMPNFTTEQIKSMLVASAVITAMSYVGKSLSDKSFDKKNLSSYLFAPIALTLIGASVVVVSYILEHVNKAILDKDILLTLLAMIPITMGLAIIGKLMNGAVKGLNFTQLVFSSIMLPVISFGIVLSSKILADVNTKINVLDVLRATVASTIVSIGAFIMLKLLSKINIKDALIGSTNLVLISGAVALSSLLLSKGVYNNYPDYKWSLGVGLGMMLLTLPVLGLGYAGLPVVAQGSLGLLMVAGAIVGMAHLFQMLPKDVIGDKGILYGLVDLLTYFVDKMSNIFVKAVKDLLPSIQQFINGIMPSLSMLLTNVLPVLGQSLGYIIEKIQPIAMSAIDAIKAIASEIDDVINSVGNVLSKVGEVISSIGDSIAKVINSIGDSFVKVKDSIVGIVNAFTSLSFKDIGKIATVSTSLTSAITDIGQAVMSIKGKEFIETSMALFYLGTGIEKLTNIKGGGLNGLSKNMSEVIKSASKLTTVASSINMLSESITGLSKALAGDKGFSSMLDRFVYNMVALSIINDNQLKKNLNSIAENYNKLGEKGSYKTNSKGDLKSSTDMTPVKSGGTTIVTNETRVTESVPVNNSGNTNSNNQSNDELIKNIKELVKLVGNLVDLNKFGNNELGRLVEITESGSISTNHIRN